MIKSLNKKLKRKSLSKVKKDCWDLFSRYIRLRDCLKTTGCSSFGLCVTCDKRYHFKLLQAGHFISGRKNANLFSEEGTHAQCYNCNINLRGNTLEYRRKIIQMYGEGYDEVLEKESQKVVKITIPDIEAIMLALKKKLEVQNA
uniref:Putative lambda recombination protein n=1 Tax=viral metagenome TaxID=1070528 RepID=A0A6H2A2S0_9ZZZZ